MRRLVLVVVVLLLGCARHPAPPVAPAEQAHYDNGGADPFAGIEVGMPLSAVGSVLGPPTSWDLQQTGRAWIPLAGPFLSDTQRMLYRYRGRGRIVMSNPGPFQQPRVIAIERDPDERGW